MPTSSSCGDLQLEQHWWQRLAQARRCPLLASDLIAAYGQVVSPELKLALAEHLAINAGDGGFDSLMTLVEQFGRESQLIRALGLCNHPQARDLLLASMQEPDVDQALILSSLERWAVQVPLSVIADAVSDPASALRLAGLQLLMHRTSEFDIYRLLHLCAEPLADFREPVVHATLAVLRRLDDPKVVRVLRDLVLESQSSSLAQQALRAIGSMATSCSALTLVELAKSRTSVEVEGELRRQLRAQFRHQDLMIMELERLQREGQLDPSLAEELRATIPAAGGVRNELRADQR